MKQHEVKCPYCGAINKVYLDETNGWLECDNCLQNINAYQVMSENALLTLWSKAFVKRGVQQA